MSESEQSKQEFAIALAAIAYGKRFISAQQFRKVVCHADDVAACERLLKDEGELSDDDLVKLRGLLNSASLKSTFDFVQSQTIATLEDSAPPQLPEISTALDGSLPTSRVRYKPIRLHATGGLGEVWLAEDQEVKRCVALKEIRPDRAQSGTNTARFLLEGKITGQLEHPGIVPVYGLGRHEDGRPFYAMRFIHGKSYKQAVDDARNRDDLDDRHYTRGVDFQRLLRSFLTASQAIDFAHSRGVIHRDIKPENIMLGEFGETLVVDWGLAKCMGQDEGPTDEVDPTFDAPLELDLGMTEPGSLLGTPAYMSPEQARAQHFKVGKPSDVYSLGATLYYLLVGRPPFLPSSDAELRGVEQDLGYRLKGNERKHVSARLMLQRVARGDFQRPMELDIRVPNRLEEICLKAMACQPEGRYQTVGEMVKDIERFFTDQPLAHWQNAIKRFSELVTTFPEESEFLAALARAMVNAGGVLASMRRFDDALDNFKRALPHFEELVGREPDKTEYMREIAVTHNLTSRALIRMNQSAAAFAEYQRAQDALEQYLQSRGCDSDPETAVLLLEPDQCGFIRTGMLDQS